MSSSLLPPSVPAARGTAVKLFVPLKFAGAVLCDEDEDEYEDVEFERDEDDDECEEPEELRELL